MDFTKPGLATLSGDAYSMRTTNQIRIHADMEEVYRAALDILEWPKILSHYSLVRVVDGDLSSDHCLVKMVASRNGFPCSWQAERFLDPKNYRIRYRHTRSTWTQGMDVWWLLRTTEDGSVEATITHEMLRSNFVTEWFRRQVVGRLFIENIANKTLSGLKQHLERGPA